MRFIYNFVKKLELMKNWLIVIVILAMANIAVAAGAFKNDSHSDNNALMLMDVESLSDDEHECLSGGPGSTSCSIGAGGGVRSTSANDAGVDYNCSVSCKEGYYACCGIRCICIKE